MELALEAQVCERGDTLPLLVQGIKAPGHRLLSGAMPADAGAVLLSESGKQLFLVSGFIWMQAVNGIAAKCALLTALAGIESAHPLSLQAQRAGYSAAIITLSDKGASGEREDTAGPQAATMLKDTLPINYINRFILPDSYEQLRALLLDLALVQKFDLICTCGGTGLGPRDITPQATKTALDQELPGFAEAMRAASLAKTPNAVISRAVCGTIGKCLVLNLPGSRRAVFENLEAVLPALEHALRKLQGDPEDCGG